MTIPDVQQAVESGIGGMNVAENIKGRRRYPINVRYQRDYRDEDGQLTGYIYMDLNTSDYGE